MLAYHNDPSIKARYLARVKAHAEADEIIKGRYWEAGKGCAVGCTIHGSDHLLYETELGIPARLAHLEDHLFERLPNGEAKKWPYLFLDSIQVGADLLTIWQKWVLWQLGDPQHGVIRYTREKDGTRQAVQRVIDLYQQWPISAGAAWAAGAAAVKAQADKLIELLTSCS